MITEPVEVEHINNKGARVNWLTHFKLCFAHLLFAAILSFTAWIFYVDFSNALKIKSEFDWNYAIWFIFNPILLGALYYYLIAYLLLLIEAIISHRKIVVYANILFVLSIISIFWQASVVLFWFCYAKD